MAERSTGASSSPSRQPRSFSMAIERLRPSVPAKAKVAHSTPAVTERRVLMSSSRAKLKIRMTSSEKTSMAESSSRERSSAERSFCTTAATAFRKFARTGLEVEARSVASMSARQRLSVEVEQVGSGHLRARGGGGNGPPRQDIEARGQVLCAGQVVRGHDHGAPAGGHGAQHLVQHRGGVLVQPGVRLVEQDHVRV